MSTARPAPEGHTSVHHPRRTPRRRLARLVPLLALFLLAALSGAGSTASAGPPTAPHTARTAPPEHDPTPEQIKEAVGRALAYPYEDVTGSYLFINGKTFDYTDLGRDAMRDARIRTDEGTPTVAEHFRRHPVQPGGLPPKAKDRTVVIAYGANRAPSALARKYASANFPRGWSAIPVLKAKLKDFEITHASHYYGNGNLPATLRYAKGAESEVFLTLLDGEELRRMHATEGLDAHSTRSWYHFAELSGLGLETAGGLGSRDTRLGRAHVYIDNYGSAVTGGRTYSLEKVRGTPVQSPKQSQRQILDRTARDVESVEVPSWVQKRCRTYEGAERFACETYVDPCIRAGRTERLMRHSELFALPPESGVRHRTVAGARVPGNPGIYPGPLCPEIPHH